MNDSFDRRTDPRHELPEESFWREEALHTRPEFSQLLHEQIMNAVTTEPADAQVQPARHAGRKRLVLVSSAATVLAVAMMILLFRWQFPLPGDSPAPQATAGSLAAKASESSKPDEGSKQDGIAWLSQILQSASVAVQSTPFRAPDDVELQVDSEPRPRSERADRKEWEATVLAEQDQIIVQIDEDALRSLADAFFTGG